MSSGTKVFVGNLAYSTTEEDLLDAFGKCGKVTEAKVVRRGNRSKGYGFVEFEDENDAQKSVESLDQVEINGRSINVQLSTSTNTGEGGDSQVRRNDNYDRPRRNDNYDRPRNNNNYRRNDNYGGERRNNNYGGERRNNDYGGGNRYNNNNSGFRRNNRDNRGRGTYSLKKNINSDSDDNNNENKRRYTKPTAEKVDSATIVFVANLPYSFYDEDLVDLFKQCGEIKTAHVVRTRGKSKGFGFVEFQTHEGQVSAIEKMNDHTVENSRGEERNLIVKIGKQEGESVKDNDENDEGKEKDDSSTSQ